MAGQHVSGRAAEVRSAHPAHSWYIVIDGHQLRQLRRDHGLTQAELASKAGISVRTLARLERLPRASCRTRTFARLAITLGEDPRATTLGPAR